MAERKKIYVLWIVHTNTESTIGGHVAAGMKKRWRGPWMAKNRREADLIDEMSRQHIAAVISVVKTAQGLGIKIVYEEYGQGKSFLQLASASGIEKKAIIKIPQQSSKGAAAAFLRAIASHGIRNFEVIFAGSFADMCIYDRANALRERGLRPYLLTGASTAYSALEARGAVKVLFGNDRLITLAQMKNLIK